MCHAKKRAIADIEAERQQNNKNNKKKKKVVSLYYNDDIPAKPLIN